MQAGDKFRQGECAHGSGEIRQWHAQVPLDDQPVCRQNFCNPLLCNTRAELYQEFSRDVQGFHGHR